jgi:hypothetical protein
MSFVRNAECLLKLKTLTTQITTCIGLYTIFIVLMFILFCTMGSYFGENWFKVLNQLKCKLLLSNSAMTFPQLKSSLLWELGHKDEWGAEDNWHSKFLVVVGYENEQWKNTMLTDVSLLLCWWYIILYTIRGEHIIFAFSNRIWDTDLELNLRANDVCMNANNGTVSTLVLSFRL